MLSIAAIINKTTIKLFILLVTTVKTFDLQAIVKESDGVQLTCLPFYFESRINGKGEVTMIIEFLVTLISI